MARTGTGNETRTDEHRASRQAPRPRAAGEKGASRVAAKDRPPSTAQATGKTRRSTQNTKQTPSGSADEGVGPGAATRAGRRGRRPRINGPEPGAEGIGAGQAATAGGAEAASATEEVSSSAGEQGSAPEARADPGAGGEAEEQSGSAEEQPTRGRPGRRPKDGVRSNALGTLIERQFADPSSPVRSYSELERRAGISREAISRYVTPRADRRRSPTVDTLAAIANAMHLSLEQISRAAAASALGLPLPSEAEEQRREAMLAPLVATLSEGQFVAVMELLRQIQPRA